jgi:hypothetical protein
MDEKDLSAIEEILKRRIRIVLEEFKHTELSKKIDAVAKDLSEHRADTEVHRGYKVSEK